MTKHTVVIGGSTNMKELEDKTVHLVVTSPPYWKLKDYGEKTEIGKGSQPYEDYMNSLCAVFRECARVLTPDGKICISNHDTYGRSGGCIRIDVAGFIHRGGS